MGAGEEEEEEEAPIRRRSQGHLGGTTGAGERGMYVYL